MGLGMGLQKNSIYFYFPEKINWQFCSKKSGQRKQCSQLGGGPGPLPDPCSPLQGCLDILKVLGMDSGPQTKNPLLLTAVAKSSEGEGYLIPGDNGIFPIAPTPKHV